MLGITVLWGGGYPTTRYALTNGFQPVPFAAVRLALAADVFSWTAIRHDGNVSAGGIR
jgi:hypothetical protein